MVIKAVLTAPLQPLEELTLQDDTSTLCPIRPSFTEESAENKLLGLPIPALPCRQGLE